MFLAADKLRKNLEPSDYKHVALGLIFLKHISNAFEAKRAALLAEDAEAAAHCKASRSAGRGALTVTTRLSERAVGRQRPRGKPVKPLTTPGSTTTGGIL